MLSLRKFHFIHHHPDTLVVVRRNFNLDQQGRMDESIDRLQDWIKAQPHFLKKDFKRDYLESLIIINKGSVEKTKKKLEKLCAIKTFSTKMFTTSILVNQMDCLKDSDFAPLPNLTSDHCRICVLRNNIKVYGPNVMPYYCILSAWSLEIMIKYNYSAGMVFILDYREAELAKLVSSLPDIRNEIIMLIRGYNLRIKALHIISASSFIEALVTLVKSLMKPKLLERIFVHNNLESLYEHVDKDLLPSDYGGKEKSLKQLSDEYLEALSSDKYVKYLDDMFQARIDLSKKPRDDFNEDYLGIPGTFRTFSID